MKLEVGMYVRTKYGIKKIESIVCGQDIKFDNTIGFDEDLRKHHDYDGISKNDNYFWNNEIVGKPSNNIIDLIQDGDYVNGSRIIKISFDSLGLIVETILYDKFREKDIKSIVTKEQFKNMEYEVK